MRRPSLGLGREALLQGAMLLAGAAAGPGRAAAQAHCVGAELRQVRGDACVLGRFLQSYLLPASFVLPAHRGLRLEEDSWRDNASARTRVHQMEKKNHEPRKMKELVEALALPSGIGTP